MPRKIKKTSRKKSTLKKRVIKNKTLKRRPLKKTISHRKTIKSLVKRKTSSNSKKTPSTNKIKASKSLKKLTIGSVKQAYTKSQVVNYLAESTALTKKDISNVLEGLSYLIEQHLKPRTGPGEFTLPNLIKCSVKHKPATKARKGISPFTGEEMTFKAKPARNVVKLRPLKKLKEMV